MNKNSTQNIANSASKSKIQLFGEQILEYVRKHPEQVEQTGKSEWTIHKDGKDFVMIDDQQFAKSGRKCFKKNLYRVEGEQRKIVQFGTYRKSLLYKLFLMVEDGHRVGKQKIDKSVVKSLAADIRVNKVNYKMDKEDLVGQFNNDEIRIKNVTTKNKSGKDVIVRKLYVNGELTTEGCLLNVPMRAFAANQKKVKKSIDEIMEEANASVADLV